MTRTGMCLVALLAMLSGCNSAEQLTGDSGSTDQSLISSMQRGAQDLPALSTGDVSETALSSSCITPRSLTIKDLHVIYWLGVCVQNYDAYIWSWKVRADPYAGGSAVLIQKRDIALYCNSNPWLCRYAIKICPR